MRRHPGMLLAGVQCLLNFLDSGYKHAGMTNVTLLNAFKRKIKSVFWITGTHFPDDPFITISHRADSAGIDSAKPQRFIFCCYIIPLRLCVFARYLGFYGRAIYG